MATTTSSAAPTNMKVKATTPFSCCVLKAASPGPPSILLEYIRPIMTAIQMTKMPLNTRNRMRQTWLSKKAPIKRTRVETRAAMLTASEDGGKIVRERVSPSAQEARTDVSRRLTEAADAFR